MRGWDRVLWGVVWQTSDHTSLIGSLHHPDEKPTYAGEPTRALLFTTRKAARAFCQSRRAQYAEYPKPHICLAWRWTPVRVRETVMPLKFQNDKAYREWEKKMARIKAKAEKTAKPSTSAKKKGRR